MICKPDWAMSPPLATTAAAGMTTYRQNQKYIFTIAKVVEI
jgi:hypothetical protein